MKYIRQTLFLIFAITISFLNLFLPAEMPVASYLDEKVYLPILMYHQVLDLPSKLGKYVISPRELEADLRLLSERGYETVTVDDLIEFCEGKRSLPKRPVMLTFDDGYQTDYLNVFPLLKKYNMKAVFSVVGAYTERYSTEGIDKHINYAHLSWDEISEMQESGLCEFQNHSYNMHSLNERHGCLKIDGEGDEHYKSIMHDDLVHSQTLFEEKLGFSPVCFTYPYGGTNDTLREMITEHGFSASLGTFEKINVLSGDPSELFDLRRYNREHGRDIAKILDKAEKLKEKTE